MARSIKVALVMLSVVSDTPHIHPVRPTVTDAVTLYRYAPGAYGGGDPPGEGGDCSMSNDGPITDDYIHRGE